jgi:hypothetical protein
MEQRTKKLMKWSSVRQQQTHLLKVRGILNLIFSYYESNSAPAYQHHHHHHVLFWIIETIMSRHEKLTPQLSKYCHFYLTPIPPANDFIVSIKLQNLWVNVQHRIYSLQSTVATPANNYIDLKQPGNLVQSITYMICIPFIAYQFRILAGTTIVYPEWDSPQFYSVSALKCENIFQNRSRPLPSMFFPLRYSIIF